MPSVEGGEPGVRDACETCSLRAHDQAPEIVADRLRSGRGLRSRESLGYAGNE